MKGDGDSLKDTTNNVTPVRTNTPYASQKGNVQKEGSLSQKESSSASLATTPTAKSVVLDLHANPEVSKLLESSCHVVPCYIMSCNVCYITLFSARICCVVLHFVMCMFMYCSVHNVYLNHLSSARNYYALF